MNGVSINTLKFYWDMTYMSAAEGNSSITHTAMGPSSEAVLTLLELNTRNPTPE